MYGLVRSPLDVFEPTVFLFVQHVLVLRLVRITEIIPNIKKSMLKCVD